MKKRYFSILTALFLTLVWGLSLAQTVPNGGFENWIGDDADNWTKDSAGGIEDYQETSIVHGGSSSAKLVINTQTQANCDYYCDNISGITAGTDYTVHVWVYDNDPAGRVTVVLDWYDASDGFLSSNYSGIYSTDGTTWEELVYTATAPTNAAKVSVRLRGYDVSANWDGDAEFYVDDITLSTAAPTPTDVADINAARAASGLIRITGTVTLVSDYDGLDSYGHQFAVQDTSGTDGQSAIIIVDSDDKISDSTNYTVGHTLTNVTGNRSSYHGLEQIVLTEDPGAPGAGSAPSPLVVTLPIADIDAIEGELIRINGLSTTATGTWAANTNYTFSDGVNDIIVRIENGCELVGDPIPTGTVDIIGIAWQYDSANQIEPRFDSDIIPSTGVEDWLLY